ncbi:hypothetical protein GW814_03195, partial [Candidatus Falkowbacteria bacterium]|nr:hypothetical protein [Candidatus Falkowbacteria bacterium]
IPLTASTTNWNTFYDTPSNRITAGNGLAWTGNTLSATSTHAALTLSGALDYITLVGQDIVRGAIDLATDITGTLGVGNGGTGATTFTNNRLLTGNSTSAIVDEANLTFDGTLLTVTGTANTTGTTTLATTAGYVGVGTIAPSATLEVYGTSQLTSALTDAGVTTGMLALNSSASSAGSGGALTFGNVQSKNAGSVGFAAIKGLLTNGSSNTTGDLAFSTRNAIADTKLTERMIIKANGFVGIGDTTPASLLTVGSGDLFQVNSSGAIAVATGLTSSGTINFSDLTASRLVATDGSKNLTNTITMANLEASVSDATNILTNTEIDTCSKLAGITGTIGSCGSFVLSVSPILTGTADLVNLDVSGATILSGGTASLYFDSELASDGYGFKRITSNDGGANWALRAGGYFSGNLKYAVTGDGYAGIRLNMESTTGTVIIDTAAAGTADATITPVSLS